jgi:hypothetical protein
MGNEIKEALAKRGAKNLQLLMHDMLGWHAGMFAEDSTTFRRS